MDDSLFLPQDIMEKKDIAKCFFHLSKALQSMKMVMSDSFDRRDPSLIKEYERDVQRKLKNLHMSLDAPKYTDTGDMDVEFVSNMAIPMAPLLEKLHNFLLKRLDTVSLFIDSNYYFGLTKNLRRYVMSHYNLTAEDLDSLQKRGSYFIYDQDRDSLFIFDKKLLPAVLKYLVYKGEDVELFYILKKMEFLLK